MLATRIDTLTIGSAYLPPARAWLLGDGRVVVEHVGSSVLPDLEAARAQFPQTEFVATDEQVEITAVHP